MTLKASGHLLAVIAAVSTAISLASDEASAENLNLSASIDTGCTIGTDTLAFGVITATSGGAATGAQISLTNCLVGGSTANQNATIAVDAGANGIGANGKRQLQHDTLGDKIEYSLTETANAGVEILPNDTFAAGIASGSGSLVFDATIAGADVTGKSAGTYLDAVGITVSFL
jgi:spore coat protein U-like protein